jgi:hypothetical protein
MDELVKAGGVAQRQDIIKKLAQRFGLTQAEREEKYKSDGEIFYHKVNDAAEQLRKEGLLRFGPEVGMPKGILILAEQTEMEEGEAKVKSAEEATEVALSFLKKHYRFIPQQPIKAVREDDVWLVEIDVGLLRTRIAKIKIDAKTAAILEYTIPPEAV